MTTRERCESAIRYRKNGANCAQSLLAAFADVMGITEAQAMAMGAGLGGGVRSGNICGAVNAPVMILGCACPEMAGSKAKAAEITKEFQRRFTDSGISTAGSCWRRRSCSLPIRRWSWRRGITAGC